MTIALRYAGGVFAVFKRDFFIFTSYRFRVVSQAFGLFFSLSTFYFISHLVRLSAFGSPAAYFAFAVYGIVIMTVLTSATVLPDLFRGELMAGTFERILVSPLGPVAGIVSMVAFEIGYSVCFATLMIVVATVAFGLPVHVAGLPEAIPIAVLGALAFAGIGLAMVAVVLVFKQTPGRAYLSAAIGLFGGAYFPITLLPHWLQIVAYVQPFTPAVDLMRHALLQTPTFEAPALELASLTAWVIVLVPLAVMALRAAVRTSSKRGTILEY